MFLMRFDMRAPDIADTTTEELYRAALEMAAWGEENGAIQLVISEHHGSPDGYLPSPLVLASAMAVRTLASPSRGSSTCSLMTLAWTPSTCG